MKRDEIVKIYKKRLTKYRQCSYGAFLDNCSKYGWEIVEDKIIKTEPRYLCEACFKQKCNCNKTFKRFMCWLSFHKWDRTDKIKQPCKNCNLVRIRVNGFNKWTSSWCYFKNDI